MIYVYLKFPDQAAWTAAYREHFAEEVDGEWRPRALVQVDEIGTIYHETGTTVVDGVETPVMTARPGWHINLIAGEMPEAMDAFMVNPVQPKRVFYGAQVLSMPEVLPEAGGTALIPRGVGQQVEDSVIARVERAVLLGRITPEDGAAKIALMQANLAIVATRELRAQRIAERDAGVAAVAAAVAERDALVAERDAQVVIRDEAIAQLATLTGAARVPVVAVRTAASAEITRLAPLISDARAVVNAAVLVRDAARDALAAVVAEMATLRAARDALLPKT
jgi:hypothetical protein